MWTVTVQALSAEQGIFLSQQQQQQQPRQRFYTDLTPQFCRFCKHRIGRDRVSVTSLVGVYERITAKAPQVVSDNQVLIR